MYIVDFSSIYIKRKIKLNIKNLFSQVTISCLSNLMNELYNGEAYMREIGGEFQYEITVTINPSIYGLTQKALEEAEENLINCFETFLGPVSWDELMIVKEYQKNRYWHWHCLLGIDEKIEANVRNKTIGYFNSRIGKTSFKPVIDSAGFYDYLNKDLERNNKCHKVNHCRIFRKS